MQKSQAKKIWNAEVAKTASAWKSEFGNEALDAEWSATAFEDVDADAVEALGLDDPWREFHDAVESEVAA